MVAAVARTLALLATATALVAAPAPARAAGGPATPAALERAGVTDIVVEGRPGLDRADRAQLRADAGVRLEEALTLPETEVVRAAPGELTEALDALNADPDVVYAEPDAPVHITATDARFAEQWALRNTGQRISGQYGAADADIDAPEAWSLGATGLGVTVAVVDTAIALTPPELASRIATNRGETGGGKESNGVDDDHDGYVDDWRGWDWVASDNDPTDEHGHGTHVSGTIAAPQDAVGVAGVAPDARILPLRVLGANGSGSGSAVASAFDLAGRRGIPVVNASLGSSGLTTAQRTAINLHPNTLYVVAAGNDGHDNDTTPTYPCVIPAPNIVCVRRDRQPRRPRELLERRRDERRPVRAGREHPLDVRQRRRLDERHVDGDAARRRRARARAPGGAVAQRRAAQAGAARRGRPRPRSRRAGRPGRAAQRGQRDPGGAHGHRPAAARPVRPDWAHDHSCAGPGPGPDPGSDRSRSGAHGPEAGAGAGPAPHARANRPAPVAAPPLPPQRRPPAPP